MVTGDGGFDYSLDYSKQEENSLRLIYSEIFVALNIQKEGGSFVCKIFDIFMKETIILLSILNESYDKVYIYKPKISRISNSEKYIICLKYKGLNQEINNILCRSFEKNTINIPIPCQFLNDIFRFNQLYCDQQINYIQKGIHLIKENKLSLKPTNDQITLAIQWCEKYNLSINTDCIYFK